MSYSAYAVANAFVQRALEGKISNLSPMKLQKLMFFAQAWHLKLKDEPFLDDNFARWSYGPVIPSIYHEFKAYGSNPIQRMATTLSMDNFKMSMHEPIIPAHDANSWALVDAIITKYGAINANQLSLMTHQAGSAWAIGGSGDGSVITAEQIKLDPTI